jgi:hypothetical protein
MGGFPGFDFYGPGGPMFFTPGGRPPYSHEHYDEEDDDEDDFQSRYSDRYHSQASSGVNTSEKENREYQQRVRELGE